LVSGGKSQSTTALDIEKEMSEHESYGGEIEQEKYDAFELED
jgi:hypothetical protein